MILTSTVKYIRNNCIIFQKKKKTHTHNARTNMKTSQFQLQMNAVYNILRFRNKISTLIRQSPIDSITCDILHRNT